jgi:predicted AAA+ superfamily ATPase
MNYKKRDMEDIFAEVSSHFKVVLVTGPRQIGKTTMLKKLMEGTDRKYVSLDDLEVRSLAKNDPKTFIEAYSPPVFIDEVQYAPDLFSYIKLEVDNRNQNGDYWLSGSQKIDLMKGVNESLAGRVGLLDLFPLSQNEIYNKKKCTPLSTEFSALQERLNDIPHATPADIFARIFYGGMPQLVAQGEISDSIKNRFYESYVRTYIERDVRDISGDVNVLKFYRFLVALAARTSQMVNYHSLADDAEIDQKTVKSWLNILETLGLIFYLHPFSNNTLKRVIKTPKLYFYDTGLVAYLARWNSVEALMNGAQNGDIFENFVISELVKGYYNNGKRPHIYYYRDKDKNEIDVLWEENGTLFPLEIKKSLNPSSRKTNIFHVLEKYKKNIGRGGIICTRSDLSPLDKNNCIIPVRCI